MIVSWMTTKGCNLRCRHCYQDAGAGPDPEELSTEEGKRLIGEIAEAGFRVMIFSGGEPLMRPDIFELVRCAAEKGLRPVFGTNGTLLTEENCGRLREAGASTMGISLDSLDPEKHDRFRGAEGSFRRTLEGISRCRKAGLPFQIHTTVMDWNREEIPDIIDFAEEEGAIAANLFFLIPVGRGGEIAGSSVELEEYEELLERIMEKQKELSIPLKPTCAPQYTRVAARLGVKLEKRFARGCLAGLSYCVVSPAGIVRPCAYMTGEAGDVRKQSFDEIWRESPLLKTLRSRAYTGSCGACAYRENCGGCRARAAARFGGDLLAEDPFCAWGRKLKTEEKDGKGQREC